MKLWNRVKTDIETDVTWNRVAYLSVKGFKALPGASGRYALEKVPIVEWLPSYKPRWLINDVVAGLTIGLMLIPQSLSYAKIAKIPVEYGLMSSWLPPAMYAVMGSTKDVSVGPTSLIGLLTSEAVTALPHRSPSEVASAMAMMMGIYGLVLGFFKLGFLLEFISLPILSGFISAVAITIGLNQIGSLLGEQDIGDGTVTQIRETFQKLPSAGGYDCAIGFSCILFITMLQQAGKYWGKKNKIIWFISITRAFLALVLYTGISYAVNGNRSANNYLFAVVEVKGGGIQRPQIPSSSLLGEVASRGISIFIGAAVEHTAIARAFGVRNDYVVDQSQELCYLGVANLVNSFFRSMGVGGAMSRTAVNDSCNVRSPLSGVVTTAIVLISIFKLVGTLYWIPKATLAAIIICAITPLVSSPKVFYRYWKTSLADWMSSMIAFWVTLLVSTQVGLAASVGFNIVYLMLRQAFANVQSISSVTESELAISLDDARGTLPPQLIPSDVRVFRFTEAIFFVNSYRLKMKVLDELATHHAPSYSEYHGAESERNWSVAKRKRVAYLRKAAGIRSPDSLPPISLVILDFAKVGYIDTTATMTLKSLFDEIHIYGGGDVEIRCVGVCESVKSRLERATWQILDGYRFDDVGVAKKMNLFNTIRDAVLIPRRRSTLVDDVGTIAQANKDIEQVFVAHREALDTPKGTDPTL